MKYMGEHNFKKTAIASVISIISFSLFSYESFAQNAIAPDNTLPVNTSVNFNSADKTYIITGGTQVGANQFHSFQDFSVPTGNTAYFNNALTTSNVIGRVTGSNISNIDGILRTNGATNLYLVNPNGITFGANAKLDIAGSFSASTANSIKFSDGSEFSATNPQAPPLLQVNVPMGLQYGQTDSNSSLSNAGNLTVREGKEITLQGGIVSSTGKLKAPSGTIKILGDRINLLSGSFVDVSSFQNTPSNGSDGGNIVLSAIGDILLNNSFLYSFTQNPSGKAGNAGNISVESSTGNIWLDKAHFDSKSIGFGAGNGGAISLHVRAIGEIKVENQSFFNVWSWSNVASTGDAGSIAMTAPQITFTDSKILASSNSYPLNANSGNAGNGGAITFNATNGGINIASSLENGNPENWAFQMWSYSTTGRAGNGGILSLSAINGDIRIQSLVGGSPFNVQSYSQSLSGSAGIGGTVTIKTNRNILLDNTLFNTTSLDRNPKDGGTIYLETTNNNISSIGNITLANSKLFTSSISNNSTSASNGGEISLKTNIGNILLANSSFYSSSLSTSGTAGNGGKISLTSENGYISLDGSPLDARSYSASNNTMNGGDITFRASSDVKLANSLISSYSSSSNLGNSRNGGAITLLSNFGGVMLTNNSALYSYSYAGSSLSGNGGAISLDSYSDIMVDRSLLYSFSASNSAQNGGEVSITSKSSNITLNSNLYSFSYSSSGNSLNGGNVFLSAINGSINGFNPLPTLIVSGTLAEGNFSSGIGGDIKLEAKNQIGNLKTVTTSSSNQSGIVIVTGTGDLTITNLKISTSQTVSGNISDPTFPDRGRDITFEFGKSGQSGNILIGGLGSLAFNKTDINSDTQGIDPAGNISIASPTQVTFQNNSKVTAITSSLGKAGDININAPVIEVNDGSQILAETKGSGTGGNITINASTSVALTRTLDSFPILSVETSNAGKAGNIVINTPTLKLSDSARITATATATATNLDGGGSVTLNASTMNLFGTVGVFAETQGFAPAGTLFLNPYSNDTALSIALTPNSQISASTSGQGNGGNLFVTAPQSINVSGSGKLAVETTGTGNAGNISFTTQNLTLTNGVLVSASTSGTGKAGDITVNANNFTLSNGAKIQTTTSGVGNSGTIKVNGKESGKKLTKESKWLK